MEQHLGRKLGRNECVHHKNGNKHDNRFENLELISRGQHSREHALKMLDQCTKNLGPARPVICVETGEWFRSVNSAAKAHGLDGKSVSRVCSGGLHTCGGYHWQYAEEKS